MHSPTEICKVICNKNCRCCRKACVQCISTCIIYVNICRNLFIELLILPNNKIMDWIELKAFAEDKCS